MDADKTYTEKAKRKLPKNAASYIEQILEATSHTTIAVRPSTSEIIQILLQCIVNIIILPTVITIPVMCMFNSFSVLYESLVIQFLLNRQFT